MSVQFGRWNWEGQPSAPEYIEKVSAVLAPYGPDSNEAYSKDGIKILYRAFHTTKESRRETQPHISSSGAAITWDGRLDNRANLISELQDVLGISATDVAIVSAAYDKWGTNCFAKLIGDWALSIWNPHQRSLILAKDPIGTRHLYYSIDKDNVTWSTILDPLVQFARRTFELNEEYIAGWFAYYPATHLTPYVGVHAVPPSSFVLVRRGKRTISKYWDFDSAKKIRYRTDAEYEEHFRTVFATAVGRRLRSDLPVLAELSGGMDSASIVCMADILIARGEAEIPRLDTISWFNDSDPRLDEGPYFTKVEEKRGRTGYHIDLGAKNQMKGGEVDVQKLFMSAFESDRLAATPDSNRNFWPELFEHYIPYMQSHGYRVTLSGIAGEDPTGGFVPTPRPELQNLLARARFLRLSRQISEWANKMRKPQLPLLWEAVRGFFTYSLRFPSAPKDLRPAQWFHRSFVRRNRAAFFWYPHRVRLFGALPSFQEQISLLNHERRYVSYCDLWPELLREIRYPYLDRDLLEFSCAIPREQIVGVGKRRFLMKRALIGIVPDEILDRKQRAPAGWEPENTPVEWPRLAEIGHHIISSSLGIIDHSLFLEALQQAERKEIVPVDSLKRTLFLESWLRHLALREVLTTTSICTIGPDRSFLETKKAPRSGLYKSSVS